MSTLSLLSSVWSSSTRFLRARLPLDNFSNSMNRADAPIMSAQEIIAYAEELESSAAKVSPNLKQSEALRQGEQSSRFMGAGMEYEESRPYQVGDEIRRINWRLMARTGQAYTKLYQEERQESWFILVDHRASMRFGTRTRIKATQAARLAGYYAWLAQQAGVPVAVGRLNDGFEHSPIFEGKSVYAQIMQAICKPCPPLAPQAESHPEPYLNDVLLSLTQQLQPGTRLILLSDFHDVNSKTTEILTAMQEFLSIKAVWVKDISESRLPQVDGLQLQSMVDNRVYDISSERQRASYQAWSKQYQAAVQQLLQQANVAFYSVYAHDNISQMSIALGKQQVRYG